MVYQQCIGFLNTPPLWLNEQFGIRQFEFPEPQLQSFKEQPIPYTIRLGHQMERVFKQLLEYSGDYEIMVYNLPVKKEKRTIGEIDFILRESEGHKLVHVELTYKFYIVDTSISEPIHRLMGPNRRDMFFTKMEKIKDRQFPLLHSPEGALALEEKGIDHSTIEHQCCFKGQLFIPYGIDKIHIRPLNMKCIVGYWLHFDTFNCTEFQSYEFYIPFKSQWVIQPHNEVDWQNHYTALMDINLRMLKENAPMVWMRKSDREFEKFFVVWW